jgi:hypothetical protein
MGLGSIGLFHCMASYGIGNHTIPKAVIRNIEDISMENKSHTTNSIN